MKSWKDVEPDKYTLVGGHRFTAGRSRPIDRIVIHHNAGVNLSSEQVRDLWNNSREASAHYQVEADGTIGQLVNDFDTAWHAANSDINARSIGIEHANISGPDRWQISDATVENGAHLVAALCHAYGLGRPKWGVNVFPHSQFTSTGCPWQLDVGGEDHDTYMRRAQYWYDHPDGDAKPAAPKHAAPQEGSSGMLTTKFFTDWNSGFFGPQFQALQDVWTQLRGPGGKGWSQLGQNDKGQNLTPVDAIAAIRQQLAQIQADLDELKEKRK